MKFVPSAVTSKVAREILVGKKHSPVILFGIGVVGFIATTVLASKASLKLDQTMDNIEDGFAVPKNMKERQVPRYTDVDYKKDMAYAYLRGGAALCKLYAPAIAVGVVSVASLTGSHVILTRRNVAFAAAYAALEKGFNDYRGRVLADVGEDKEHEYRYPLCEIEDPADSKKKIKIVSPDSATVYARFFDEYSSSWNRTPEYNLIFLKCQQNYANDLLRSRGHVFLNEVYDMLGIERSKAGAVVGWVISKGDGDNFIDFGIFDGDNPRARMFTNGLEPSILLDFNVDGVIYDKI